MALRKKPKDGDMPIIIDDGGVRDVKGVRVKQGRIQSPDLPLIELAPRKNNSLDKLILSEVFVKIDGKMVSLGNEFTDCKMTFAADVVKLRLKDGAGSIKVDSRVRDANGKATLFDVSNSGPLVSVELKGPDETFKTKSITLVKWVLIK